MTLWRAVLVCFGATLLAVGASGQSLPDGPGKELVAKVCSQCHEAEVVVGKKLAKEAWSAVVDDMASRGAQATDEEFEKIVEYLAKNFPKDSGTSKIEWRSYSTYKR